MTSQNTSTTPVITNGARRIAYETLIAAREGGYDPGQTSAQILEAVTPLLVAAELWRLVGEHSSKGEITFADLLRRADELDPPAGTRED